MYYIYWITYIVLFNKLRSLLAASSNNNNNNNNNNNINNKVSYLHRLIFFSQRLLSTKDHKVNIVIKNNNRYYN